MPKKKMMSCAKNAVKGPRKDTRIRPLYDQADHAVSYMRGGQGSHEDSRRKADRKDRHNVFQGW
ncbi:hypothetical protein [Deinococcus soli (ex Cha et al. 2016)]|uniref:Uncharacterized protein n=2 Tax=Deinococcus soli (ex Cha et al. 2016) TaxID=1309411 RepID=A0ACC6KFK7_9DEIO|nr:hypothetical protein [Deinococcus soli (ex Cha et al. 2016)]MDR6218277.1 hypothetical protein [Deinococcus soli (ex Cha et al. 2016)]MDR6329017.1 hypothetical protein [Deinococcus soli (ex Cha et al. 2016)]MDR6751290.1 hypothetical protein [Deinococcus soli (ex Cha et al. 2016)]